MASEGISPRVSVFDNGQRSEPMLSSLLPEGTKVERMTSNGGYTTAANTALEGWLQDPTSPEFCIVGSHDLHVEPDALSNLVEAAMKNDRLGVIGPLLTQPDPSSGGVWEGRSGYQMPIEPCSGFLARDWISGTCMLLRKSCIQQIGKFDEAFGSYVEDVDLSLRAADEGWLVGVVCEARARGLGSGEWLARAAVSPNVFLLVAKRQGIVQALPVFGSMIVDTVRAAVGSFALWRKRERRTHSRVYLRRHLRAFVVLARKLPYIFANYTRRRS